MRIRTLKPEDVPILEQFAKQSGFEYPDLNHPHIEAFLVVADDEDAPIIAVAAKRLVEVYGWFNPEARADLRLQAIDLIHTAMIDALKKLGYECAEVFIPPQLERRGFGSILTSRFGWAKNLVSYGRRLF